MSTTPFQKPSNRSKARAKRAARLRHGSAAALLGVAALLSGAVSAQPRIPGTPGQGVERAPFSGAQQISPRAAISLAQATSIAQGRYPGRVVRAVTLMQGDRVIHEIRILTDDDRRTVRTVLIDGQTGAFL